ncbi:MAG: 1-acyl-sn-glycerol-3-phosphate acyltransferase [Clostridia bacterium]|nr:1-acyl-sn-glycerol-3-phosphate acyltransferase [Clostridia bacterium]
MRILRKISRGIVIVVLNIVFRTVYRMKVIGAKNIPKEGAYIFCGNHKSYMDPPAIAVTNRRKMSFLAKEELKKNPLFAFLGWAFECIWVKRDSKDIGPLKQSIAILKTGDCLGIFPEGTRNGMEKNNGELKNGAAYLALKMKAPIIPVGIIGAAKPFTKNAVIYGNPIDISKYADQKVDKELEDKLNEELKKEILALTSTQI